MDHAMYEAEQTRAIGGDKREHGLRRIDQARERLSRYVLWQRGFVKVEIPGPEGAPVGLISGGKKTDFEGVHTAGVARPSERASCAASAKPTTPLLAQTMGA